MILSNLKQHLFIQHKIEEIQKPTVTFEAQKQEEKTKIQKKKRRKYKIQKKNKNETFAYVQSMLTSENQHGRGS